MTDKPHIDREVKKRFVKNMIETTNNRTEAYLRTMPTAHSRKYASAAGSRLFNDPEVQDIFKSVGIDLSYIAQKNKELMESSNEAVKASMVRQWNKAVIPVRPTTQEVKKLNINLFGDLTDAQVERIRTGNKVTGETERVVDVKPE
jgi:hypothetical protein